MIPAQTTTYRHTNGQHLLIFIVLGKQNIYFHNHSRYMRRKTDKNYLRLDRTQKNIKLKQNIKSSLYTKLSRLEVGISEEL